MTKNNTRCRIAIFTTYDKTWNFPVWKKTIPVLMQKYDVVGICLIPEKLNKMEGFQIPLWYLRVFGLINFIILGLFSLKTRTLQLFSPMRSWKQLAAKYNLDLISEQTPNSKTVYEWVKQNNIDVVLIMMGHILKEQIIQAPNIGIINKHAAVLPSCKGLFPFFWGNLTNNPTGITFHMVEKGIDTGKILVQVKHPVFKSESISMLRFYIDVFYLYPYLAVSALEMLIESKFLKINSDITPSYFSLPRRQDYINYRKKAFKISRFSDLFYNPSSHLQEIVNEICCN